jgi:hypothetical protein
VTKIPPRIRPTNIVAVERNFVTVRVNIVTVGTIFVSSDKTLFPQACHVTLGVPLTPSTATPKRDFLIPQDLRATKSHRRLQDARSPFHVRICVQIPDRACRPAKRLNASGYRRRPSKFNVIGQLRSLLFRHLPIGIFILRRALAKSPAEPRSERPLARMWAGSPS